MMLKILRFAGLHFLLLKACACQGLDEDSSSCQQLGQQQGLGSALLQSRRSATRRIAPALEDLDGRLEHRLYAALEGHVPAALSARPLELCQRAFRALGWQFVVAGSMLFVLVCIGSIWLLNVHGQALKVLGLSVTYSGVSSALIQTNKWLMHVERFPYPVTLVSMHMLISWSFMLCLSRIYPAAFPALGKLDVTWRFVSKFIPIGALFAISVVFSTAAYKYLSVPFLQFMKQANVVLIYAFSIVCGLDALTRCSSWLLLLTLVGTMLTIRGELHFQIFGFLLQVGSSCAEAGKVVTQGILMSGSLKLDPLTLILFMAPACLLAVMVPFLTAEMSSAMLVRYKEHWPVILASSMLAITLNVLIACCIKEMSPTGYIMMGTLKDVFIVSVAALVVGDPLTLQQIVGFVVALVSVLVYSLYRKNIDCFEEDDLFIGCRRCLQQLTEKTPPLSTEVATDKPPP